MSLTDELGGSAPSRRAIWILAAGCVLGLALSATALLSTGVPLAAGLYPGAAAVVNGEPIRTAELERAIVGLVRDRGEPLEPFARGPVLDRLIEEELLLQRALELGLPRSDPRARRELVSALIRSVTSEAEAGEPSQEEVSAFYRENREIFSRSLRLRAHPVRIALGADSDEAGALQRALQVRSRLLSGEPYARVLAEHGADAAGVPDRLLAAKKLRDYLGPTAARTLSEMEPGEISQPLRVAGGFLVVALAERQASWAPSLEEIESEVRSELRRRAGDLALRRYIEELREAAAIRVADGAS